MAEGFSPGFQYLIDATLPLSAAEEQAAKTELHLNYSEPPYYPRPVLEALGQVALKHGRTKEAESAFKRALEQYPASYRAQTGLRAALGQQGKPTQAADH